MEYDRAEIEPNTGSGSIVVELYRRRMYDGEEPVVTLGKREKVDAVLLDGVRIDAAGHVTLTKESAGSMFTFTVREGHDGRREVALSTGRGGSTMNTV